MQTSRPHQARELRTRSLRARTPRLPRAGVAATRPSPVGATVFTPSAALAATLVAALALSPLHARAQTPDTRAPLVEIERLGESTADAIQTFTAQVADDRELDDVTLHHRRAGEVPFERVPMRPLGASGTFGASLPTDPEDLRAIEYYVQALDGSGNRTVSGFAFDPIVRTLRPRGAALAAGPTPSDPPPIGASGGTRWWAIALGVLAVGAIASLAGDDGGGGGTVPLTIDLPEPDAR